MSKRVSARVNERGSMTLIMTSIVSATFLLLAGMITVAHVLLASERARASADEAALAGAGVLLNPASLGDACAAAGAMARANDAQLISCHTGGTWVQVDVRVPALPGRDATALARAGAPEAMTPKAVRP